MTRTVGPRTRSSGSRRRMVTAIGLVGALGLTGTAVAVQAAADRPGSSPSRPVVDGAKPMAWRNLVVNGGFERGLAGWRTNGSSQRLSVSSGRYGTHAAQLTTRTRQTVALNDAANTVRSTKAGEVYALSAWVKASRPGVYGEVRAREVNGSQVRIHAAKFALRNTSWQRVSVRFSPRRPGAYLDLNVVGWKLQPGKALRIDNVALFAKTFGGGPHPTGTPKPTPKPTSTPRPTTPGPTTPQPTDSPTPTPTTPSGGPLLGIYNGPPVNDDATKRAFGAYPDFASTYYQGNKPINVANERSRIAKGILPVLTITANRGSVGLAQIGSGSADAWIDRYAADIASLNSRVMVTLDHEFDVKYAQGNLTHKATPGDYVKAFNRFTSRVKAKAPRAQIGYWMGGYQKDTIDSIAAGLKGVEWVGYDPYSTDNHPASETFEQTVTPTLQWIRGRSWYKNQPIFLTEFGSDTAHGDASVAAYMSKLRPRMKKLGLAGALLFNRDRQDFDGQNVRYRLDSGRTPKALAAFRASLRR